MKQLQNLITQIETYLPQAEVENTSVSKSNVAWHLDHSLKVINNVSKALEASDPDDYKNNFSFLGKVFLTLGYFPRGKAKAPKYVKPPEVITANDLVAQIKTAKSNIEIIANLDQNAFFKHPYFGNINTKRVSRFLEVHTKHHLKIVNDILR